MSNGRSTWSRWRIGVPGTFRAFFFRLHAILAVVLVTVHPLPSASSADCFFTVVPEEVVRRIADDEARPTPRLAGGRPSHVETEGWTPVDRQPRARVLPEYEPAAAVLLRWGTFNDVLAQVVVGVTVHAEFGVARVIVNSEAQEKRARATLEMAGADLARVEFIRYLTDSAWVRDFGPQFIVDGVDDGASQTVLDFAYEQPRPRDDALPAYLSEQWHRSRVDVPLVHGGGNIHVFSNGDAFASEILLSQNRNVARWRLASAMLALADLRLALYPAFPREFDRTGHIDMWFQPVADDEVLIGRYDPTETEPHRISELAAADLADRGYTVHRTPGWRSWGVHYTYTNALIFNNLVFMPVYKRYRQQNREAHSVFKRAFPGRKIIPVDCSRPVALGGALHCLVLSIPMNP